MTLKLGSVAFGLRHSGTRMSYSRSGRAYGVAMMMLLASSAVSAQPAPQVRILSDAACPLVLERAALIASQDGVSMTYSIRNPEKSAVREIVITAAALDTAGEVVSLRMQPVAGKIAGRSSRQFAVVFTDLDMTNADTVVIGVQGVRWSGRRQEWQTALRVSAPDARTAK